MPIINYWNKHHSSSALCSSYNSKTLYIFRANKGVRREETETPPPLCQICVIWPGIQTGNYWVTSSPLYPLGVIFICSSTIWITVSHKFKKEISSQYCKFKWWIIYCMHLMISYRSLRCPPCLCSWPARGKHGSHVCCRSSAHTAQLQGGVLSPTNTWWWRNISLSEERYREKRELKMKIQRLSAIQ